MKQKFVIKIYYFSLKKDSNVILNSNHKFVYIASDTLEKFKAYEVQVILTTGNLTKVFGSALDEKNCLFLKINDSENLMNVNIFNSNNDKNTIDCSQVLIDGKTLFTDILPMVYKNIPIMIGLEINKEDFR